MNSFPGDDKSVLILADGGLPSLLALAAARESFSLSKMVTKTGGQAGTAEGTLGKKSVRNQGVLFMPGGDETNHLRRLAVDRQSALLEITRVDAAAHGELRGPGAHGTGQADTLRLIAAAYVAARHGYEVVVWPVQFGGTGGLDTPDIDRIARTTDRALLVTRLVSLDAEEHGRPGIRVETPFVDFSDRQIADLALDMSLPVETCWWWSEGVAHSGPRTPLADSEYERWTTALREVGWTRGREAGVAG